MHGHLGKGIQSPMAQGRSIKIISMIKWIRTKRLSMRDTLFDTEPPSTTLCSSGRCWHRSGSWLPGAAARAAGGGAPAQISTI